MMKSNSTALLFALCAILFPILSNAEVSKAPPASSFQISSGQMQFDALGRPSALKIHGVGTGVSGEIKATGNLMKGKFLFKPETLDTGLKLRNEHMKKKYLETDKFPDAVLVLDELTIPKSATDTVQTAENVPFKGHLTLHGVEKPVQGTALINFSKSKFDGDASFSVKTSDFQINTPSFAGVTMGEDVQVKVSFTSSVAGAKL
ncbi:MAG: YceI family protein [Methylotenera sp.]|nr:YceI family protein [Oligoflexia bacterium]